MTAAKEEIDRVQAALAAPFDPGEVKFKPAVVSGNRALALPYVDARVIQDRLDDVLGVMGWQDGYKVLSDGSVLCRLRIQVGGTWITKVDVGSQSEQPDGGDRMKAAVSDALKRAAVKFGIGRYLYRAPQQWCDYDPHKRQFVRPPALPAAAAPPAPKKEPDGPRPTAAEVEELRKRLQARGKAEANLVRWLGLPLTTRLQDLGRSEYRRALAAIPPVKGGA